MTPPGEGRAVVVGASMAGLSAARALSGRMASVVVYEADRLDGGARPRAHVPQGRHLVDCSVRNSRILRHLAASGALVPTVTPGRDRHRPQLVLPGAQGERLRGRTVVLAAHVSVPVARTFNRSSS